MFGEGVSLKGPLVRDERLLYPVYKEQSYHFEVAMTASKLKDKASGQASFAVVLILESFGIIGAQDYSYSQI